MRIGVLQTQVPFVSGGAERHSANLCAALRRHGHEVAEITLPFKWYPQGALIDSILAARLTDVSEIEAVPTDLTIGLRFPAYLAQHPDKVFWIIHQYRQAYDQWTAGVSDLLDQPDGEAIRHLVMAEDRDAFARSRHPIYANSRTVAQRLKTYLGQEAVALYHPPPNAELFTQGAFGDYLFAPGRLNRSKRPELLLQALALTRPPLQLVIAGVPENPAYLQDLKTLAGKLGIAERVTWLGGIDDATMRARYANARAVVFVPRDEDYGYITLEAMLAGKPVITTEDAGGPLEFISDGTEGLVCAPDPRALADRFETMMQGKAQAERMGAASLARYRALDIGWDQVVETLTQGQSRPGDAARPALIEGAVQTATAVGVAGDGQAIGQDPQKRAVERLRAAIAPRRDRPENGPENGPEGLPFQSISEVLAAYDFETLPRAPDAGPHEIDTGLSDYLSTHWQRFQTTLDLVVERAPKDILDVGVFPPFVFEAMMINMLPDASLHGVWEGPAPYAQQIRSHDGTRPEFGISLRPANIERDTMPYDDASFDFVLGMEILEHLALDPYFFLSQVNRVLRPGGHILLTTPNIGSHRGVWKILNGISPYSFGIFVPTGGVYGRHNREYTPREVETLARAAGFETEVLRTADVYDDGIDPATAELLVARDDDLSLRGETIFYLGRKTSAPSGPPEGFYHGAPEKMAGRLSVVAHEEDTGLVRIRAENRSPAWWSADGDGATMIAAAWLDGEGVLRHTGVLLPLGDAIAPSGQRQITLRVDPGAAAGARDAGTLQLDLVQSGIGSLTTTGRANTVLLPCSEAAFLKLVRQGA